jgi:glutathione-regulated potassium-efflux system protein KefB
MHVLVIVLVKAAVLYLAARVIRMAHAPAARVAFLLAQAGEFGFVILGTLLASGVITPAQFANGIMVVALTTIMTPLLDTMGMIWSRLSRSVMPGTSASTS